jgi:23S rRNA (uracil1939-C5)-methyltransferase
LSVSPGAELELAIEALAAGGDGVGRVDGLAVFVPLAAPGDRVRARVTQIRPRFARAEIVELLSPGPSRRSAPCPYYGRCGGCTWLHLDESEQLRARVAIARAALERIAHRAALPEIEVVASPRALGYRARARVGFERGRIGFRARGSHELVDIERCAVLEADASGARARAAAPPAGKASSRSSASAPRPSRAAAGDRQGAFSRRIARSGSPGGPPCSSSAGAALGRRALLRRRLLHRRTVRALRPGGAVSARRGRRERRAQRVGRGRPRPRRSGRRASSRGAAGAGAANRPARVPQCVGRDPRLGASRLVYVSCEPATLARDLARIGARFRIARLVLLDALPQTHHVELVVALEWD